VIPGGQHVSEQTISIPLNPATERLHFGRCSAARCRVTGRRQPLDLAGGIRHCGGYGIGRAEQQFFAPRQHRFTGEIVDA